MFKTYRKITKSLEGSGLSKIPFVRQAHNKLIKSLAPQIVEMGGFKMYHLGSLYDDSDFFVKVLQKNIRYGDLVLDVGANIGYYTMLMSKIVGDSGKVYAFEPEPKNFEILQKNIKINNIKNVIIEKFALSDKIGKSYLQISKDSGQHRLSDSGLETQTTTIDNYFGNKKIDFIKMDAEGSEYNIFKGMKQRPNMITEFYYKLLDSPEQFLNDLQEDYELFDVRDDLKPVIKQEVILKYKEGATDLFCKYSK